MEKKEHCFGQATTEIKTRLPSLEKEAKSPRNDKEPSGAQRQSRSEETRESEIAETTAWAERRAGLDT